MLLNEKWWKLLKITLFTYSERFEIRRATVALLISLVVVKLAFLSSTSDKNLDILRGNLSWNGKVNDVYVGVRNQDFVRGYVVRSATNGCYGVFG
jgi:hypothetical protein